MVPINSYDTAGSFLILGCNNGSIYYIGTRGPITVFNTGLVSMKAALTGQSSKMLLASGDSVIADSLSLFIYPDVQKFPLRMKDNDLLVTELYRDPTEDAITALSVYLTPKTSMAALLTNNILVMFLCMLQSLLMVWVSIELLWCGFQSGSGAVCVCVMGFWGVNLHATNQPPA